MNLLANKVAIITGAGRGIGRAIALKYAQEGASVVITDLKIDETVEAFVKELEGLGVKAKAYASNAANFEDAHKLVEEVVADFGRIDILVNNAGITRDGLMMRMTEEQWDLVINVNLKSAFNLIHAVTPSWSSSAAVASSTWPASSVSLATQVRRTTPLLRLV